MTEHDIEQAVWVISHAPWQSTGWLGAVRVFLGRPSTGFATLKLRLSALDQRLDVALSDVYPPFDDLLAWLNGLADGALPAALDINEEWRTVRLQALATHAGSDEVALLVWHRYALPLEEGSHRLLLACRCSRVGLALAFARPMRLWLQQRNLGRSRFSLDRSADLSPRESRRYIREHLDMAPLFAKLRALRRADAPRGERRAAAQRASSGARKRPV
jgi:hypothetical protein